MQNQWTAWLVTILGVLLILPKISITQLGDLSTGITSWLAPIIILIIGIWELIKVYSK